MALFKKSETEDDKPEKVVEVKPSAVKAAPVDNSGSEEAVKAKPKAKKSPSARCTVTLLVASQITDPGTGILLKKGVEVIVPEISSWVRMQAETTPKYLTFSE